MEFAQGSLCDSWVLRVESHPSRQLPPAVLPLCEGPRDTPFDGGVFYVNIELDDHYPFVPPKMRFITKAGAAALRCSWGSPSAGGCGGAGWGARS